MKQTLTALIAVLIPGSFPASGSVDVTSTSLAGDVSASIASSEGGLLSADAAVRIGFFHDPDDPLTQAIVRGEDFAAIDNIFVALGEDTASETDGSGGPLRINDAGSAGNYGGTISRIDASYLSPGTRLFLWVFNSATPAAATEWGIFHDPSWLSPNNLGSINLATFQIDDATEAWRGSVDPVSGQLRLRPISNSPPLAVDDSISTDEDVGTLIAVLANDSDPDQDPVALTNIASAPTSGSAVIEDGQVRYTPHDDFNGADAFVYEISDGNGGVAQATVTITVSPVNDSPDSRDDSGVTAEDVAVVIPVLENDSDVDGDTLQINRIVTRPQNGSAALQGTSILYTPSENFNGSDQLAYEISDGNGGFSQATLTITVTPVNDPPVAADDSATLDEDNPATIAVAANDSDVDGDPLTIDAIVGVPSNGTAIINASAITYTPAENFHGSDSFQYRISDGSASALATVTLTVAPLNDIPDAREDTAVTDEDSTLSIDVLANDEDVDGDTLTIAQILAPPSNGSAVIENGRVRYSPTEHFNGSDQFIYEASDGNGGMATAVVLITIHPVNDDPIAVPDTASTVDQDPVTIMVLGNDSDVDGDTMVIARIVSPPSRGAAEVVANGIVYTPEPAFEGIDTLTYEISDGKGGLAQATVEVTVTSTSLPAVTLASFNRRSGSSGTLTFAIERSGSWRFEVQHSSDLARLPWTAIDGVVFESSDDGLSWSATVPLDPARREDYFRILIGRP